MGRVTRTRTEADCADCDWSGHRAGALGRAAIHHDRTGHRVETTRLTVYDRAVDPAQLTIADAPDSSPTVHA